MAVLAFLSCGNGSYTTPNIEDLLDKRRKSFSQRFTKKLEEPCPHLVTRELSSSWTVNTSLPWAFQSEVARSDLGGTWPKGGNLRWLLAISVLRKRPVFRTDVPSGQQKEASTHCGWTHHSGDHLPYLEPTEEL